MSHHRNHTLLWSVDYMGIRSYILGTIHVRHAATFSLIDGIDEYMTSCRMYLAEMDLHHFDPMSFQKAAQLPEGLTLRAFVSPRRLARMLTSIRRSFGVDLSTQLHIHPFLLAGRLLETAVRSDEALIMDHHLWHMADSYQMKRGGLESFDRQLEIMRSIPVKPSVRSLLKIARHPAAFRRRVTSMLDGYCRQDAQLLYRATRKTLGDLRKSLLYNRNIEMANEFLRHCREQPVFAAVGAAHLMGQQGMVRLIKHQGAKVRPISLTGHDRFR